MKTLIAGDTTNRSNWGCRATSAALHRMVSERSTTIGSIDLNRASLSPENLQSPDHGYISKIVGKLPGSHLLLNLGSLFSEISRTSIRKARARNIEVFSDAIYRGIAFPKLTQALHETDWLLINGEGTIIQNRPYGHLCFLLAYAAKSRFGKKCAIVNHTADTRHPSLRETASAVYPLIDIAAFREHFSFELNKDLCAPGSAIIAPDAAFTYEPCELETLVRVASRPGYYSYFPDSSNFDPEYPYICIGGSAHFMSKGYSHLKVQKAYYSLAKCLTKRAQVVITAASHPDDIILRPVAHQLGIPYVGLNTPTYQALDILGNSRLYIGGRWHPAIMSLTGGTPIILLSSNTDFKSRGLLDLFGLKQPEWSALNFGDHEREIIDLADSMLEQGLSLRASIRKTSAELRALAYKNADFL